MVSTGLGHDEQIRHGLSLLLSFRLAVVLGGSLVVFTSIPPCNNLIQKRNLVRIPSCVVECLMFGSKARQDWIVMALNGNYLSM